MAELNEMSEHTDVADLLDADELLDESERVICEAWVPDVGDTVVVCDEYYPSRTVVCVYTVVDLNADLGTAMVVDEAGVVRTVDRYGVSRATPDGACGIESDPAAPDYERRLRLRMAERSLTTPGEED